MFTPTQIDGFLDGMDRRARNTTEIRSLWQSFFMRENDNKLRQALLPTRKALQEAIEQWGSEIDRLAAVHQETSIEGPEYLPEKVRELYGWGIWAEKLLDRGLSLEKFPGIEGERGAAKPILHFVRSEFRGPVKAFVSGR